MKKILILILLLFISGCGKKPVSKKARQFKIGEVVLISPDSREGVISDYYVYTDHFHVRYVVKGEYTDEYRTEVFDEKELRKK
jgi:hypothetical protein